MLVVAMMLLLVWVLAIVSAVTMGGAAHVLLAGAIALLAAWVVQFRRAHHHLPERS